MKLIISGIGFNDLITLRALRAAGSSDVIIVPRTHKDTIGYAQRFMSELLPDKKYTHIIFPMINDAGKRNAAILSELERIRADWDGAQTIFFPVIGDAMLYSTGEYLIEAFRKLEPDLETEFIPGISAHSLAAATAQRFLAMRDEILAVIPGTAPLSKILLALSGCECAAIYKPSALLEIEQLADDFRIKNFGHIIRVDYAGIPERERIIEGEEALRDISEYMSIILLWRD